jgi:hypothetical protein
MLDLQKMQDEEILQTIKNPPEINRIKLFEYIDSLIKTSEIKNNYDISLAAVESTWGRFKLDKKLIRYIAEDKELEYEF